MIDLIVWAADIGSVKKKRFGWCRSPFPKDSNDFEVDTNISALAEGVAKDLSDGKKIALGFECPLFVPVRDDPEELTSKRQGEENRPWSASAGATVLVTGLTECVWIFEKIHCQVNASIPIRPTFNWKELVSGTANLFIWEAFVTGTSKADSNSHCKDAETAVRTFLDKYHEIGNEINNAVSEEKPYSLVGAGLLRSGLTTDLSLLFKPCVVIKS